MWNVFEQKKIISRILFLNTTQIMKQNKTYDLISSETMYKIIRRLGTNKNL